MIIVANKLLNFNSILKLFVNNINMFKSLMYPNIFGVSAIFNGNKVSCIIKNNGKVNIFSKKTFKINKCFNNFLLRGFAFLFVGIFYFITGLFEFNDVYNKEGLLIAKKVKQSLNISIKSICFFIVILFSIFLSYVVFGVIPLKLSYIISPQNYNVFFKRLIIGIVKCFIIYICFLTLKLVPAFRQYCKFNSAIKKCEDKNNQVNFLTYFICSVFLCVMVLSVLGLVIKWYSVFINFIIFIFVFGLNYELFKLISKNKGFNWIIFPFYFLIKEKPSQNEIKCVNIVLKELEQGKIIMEQTNLDEIAFSESYVYAKEILENAGRFEKSDLDFIYCEILNKNRAELKLIKSISKKDHKKVLDAIQRRAKGEPITKIFGHTNFYGLDFKVTKEVLSPRIDTEVLVEEVLKVCNAKTKVLDIGTGSGAIAITIAKESGAKVTAVDISDEALKVAKENAKLNDVNITFKKSDLFSAISKFAKFDIIVSNPPYIPSAEIDALDDEVKNFDPRLALDGGESGLVFYERIIMDLPKYLTKNGKIFFEIGYLQAKDLKKLLQKNFKDIRIVKDYEKNDRVVIATLNS